MIDKEEIKFANKLVLWVFGGFVLLAIAAIYLEKIFGSPKVFLYPLT